MILKKFFKTIFLRIFWFGRHPNTFLHSPPTHSNLTWSVSKWFSVILTCTKMCGDVTSSLTSIRRESSPCFLSCSAGVFSLRFERQKSEHASDYCWPITSSKFICCRPCCRQAKLTWRLENTLEESHGHACPSQDVRSKARPC